MLKKIALSLMTNILRISLRQRVKLKRENFNSPIVIFFIQFLDFKVVDAWDQSDDLPHPRKEIKKERVDPDSSSRKRTDSERSRNRDSRRDKDNESKKSRSPDRVRRPSPPRARRFSPFRRRPPPPRRVSPPPNRRNNPSSSSRPSFLEEITQKIPELVHDQLNNGQMQFNQNMQYGYGMMQQNQNFMPTPNFMQGPNHMQQFPMMDQFGQPYQMNFNNPGLIMNPMVQPSTATMIQPPGTMLPTPMPVPAPVAPPGLQTSPVETIEQVKVPSAPKGINIQQAKKKVKLSLHYLNLHICNRIF
jgi:hypothetical protein